MSTTNSSPDTDTDTDPLASDGARVETNGDHVSLEWGFWKSQLDTLRLLRDGNHDVVVFRGGYGSGKSVLGSRWTIQTAIAVPESDCLVMAQDRQKGKSTTFRVFFEELPGADLSPSRGGDPENSPVVADYHATDMRLTLKNGSVVRLGSADRWNRFAGAEFNAIWCDEVAHYETTDLFDLNRMLLSRQRTDKGPNQTLWTSTGNGYNQFYEFVEKQQTPDGDRLPTEVANVVADSRNNPFLSETEKLSRQFEGTVKEEQGLAGGFAAPEGLVYSEFSRNRHVVSASKVADQLVDDWRMYGYDAGWNDPRVVVEVARTNLGQYVVVDHFYESEAALSAVVDPDNATRGPAWMDGRPDGPVYCEHEPADRQQFAKAGWTALKADKSLDAGIPHVRERLQTDSDGRPGLLVVDDCTDLIQEFMSYKQDHVGTATADDHALDALRYALFSHDGRGGNDSADDGTGVSYL